MSSAKRRVPRATYRLQFKSGFGFAEGAALVPYLNRLGISDLYASPLFRARPGSTHGYDVTDHNMLNPELGPPQAFEAMAAALRQHGLGLLLDIVPNHMGIGYSDNAAWLDVLEWGRDSPHAADFDIDWEANPDLPGKVLLPILGGAYGEVLEQGEISLRFDLAEGTFSAWYYEHRCPVSPLHYRRILSPALARLTAAKASEAAPLQDLLAEFDSLSLPLRSQRSRRHRREQAEHLKGRLAALASAQPAVGAAIAAAVATLNGRAGEPPSLLALHRLLEAQAWRLAYWRVASNEINYRRFFDINDLAGIRVELPEVFERSHRLILRLLAEGKVQGLRVDHIDGLYNPAGYCRELQARAAALGVEATAAEPLYLVVEKILAQHEALRDDWPVAGTTGYEFANLLNGLFVDSASEPQFDRLYNRFLGHRADFEDILFDCKRRIIDGALASEMTVLARELTRIAKSHWRSRDFTYSGLREALSEVVACFPVYRTYIDGRRIAPEDRHSIEWAIGRARRRSPMGDLSIFDFIQTALTTDLLRPGSGYSQRSVVRFAMKFQQYTGPVMAKGLEDTAFYRYWRLASLNEVGGDPRRFGVSLNAFHTVVQERSRRWPDTLVATATHDTKRGEDTRVRISALSELPDEWGKRSRRWTRLNRLKRREIEGSPAPCPEDEFLLYQTLLGSWPLDLAGPPPWPDDRIEDYRVRLEGYLVKAMREAKRQSSWRRPNELYEAAVTGFMRDLLNNLPVNPFLADFLPFQERIAHLGMLNGLSQLLLKLTIPGVPDVYQGTELWDLSLVDPDNRRPVDYAARAAMLDRLERDFGPAEKPGGDPAALLADWRSGLVKLFVLWRGLACRRRWPALFARGSYLPLTAAGARGEHLCAFARGHDGELLVVAVPRLCAGLLDDPLGLPVGAGCWQDTVVPLSGDAAGVQFADLLTGRRIATAAGPNGPVLPAAELFQRFPAALLWRVESAQQQS